jgi:hypothetical protein
MAELSTMRPRPAFTIPSILAAICAAGSFASDAGWAFVLAVLAIVLGALGVLLAIAPGKRGGMISAISIIAGLFGIILAILKFVF